MKKLITLTVIFLVAFSAFAQKSKLSVIYVGWNPNHPEQHMGKGFASKEAFEEKKLRWADFEHFLNKHFETVKMVHHWDYKAEMSDNYDVTIFDAMPPKIKERIVEKDANGHTTKFEFEQYIPAYFSAATITLAQMSEKTRYSVKHKLDWCCLCLGKYGFNTNVEHEIFNSPNKVQLEWEDVETPENFLKYGKGYGKTMKMWEVQKMGYERGSLLEPGLVSRGTGFLDSPDAEFISEGNHTKAPGQIALGRHGNFFHWGFSAPPKYMTEQAKKVFLNTIHYIAKFKGQRPLSKKLVQTMWLQNRVIDNATKDYRKEYDTYVKTLEVFNVQIEASRKEILAKKEKGEELSDVEKYYLTAKPEPIPSIEEFMQLMERELYPRFGLDFKKYNEYYKTYAAYMRANPENLNTYIIDEEAMKFGMSFNHPQFLESCIKSLKDSEKKDLALLLLKRYTLESFNKTSDWEKWYNKNKAVLFFTETGGCKYMINIYK